jgi:hypothetical protein
MQHSPEGVNGLGLRCSVRRCSALGLPGRRAAAMTWDVIRRIDPVQ